jgi:hypothetical protein
MKSRRAITTIAILTTLMLTLGVSHALAQAQLKQSSHPRRAAKRVTIPPVVVLNNPEYLSGEASISVAANSNPLLRIGMAQNGVTLIEFPASDKFFAVHAGNSDLVTIEKSPSLKRDHHLVLRTGSGFLMPGSRGKGSQTIAPAASIVAQMDSGIAITVMVYPVALLKQQAHRVVIRYSTEEVINARRVAGLATNLTAPEPTLESPRLETKRAPTIEATVAPVATKPVDLSPPEPDYREPAEAALRDAIKNPKWFQQWTKTRHSLSISTLPPHDLSGSARLVLFAVRNTGSESVRLISGYPDLYVETVNEKHRPVEAGPRIAKLHLVSSISDASIQPGAIRYFALVYELPILGVQQHLKLVIAHMSAADEPATADLTVPAK